MTILTPEKAEQVLTGKGNLLNRLGESSVKIVEKSNHKEVNKSIPDEVKKDVTDFVFNNPEMEYKDVAASFGIGERTVKGVIYGEKGDSEDLSSHREKRREEVSDVAVEKVLVSLGLMTEKKLSGASARDLSSIAANMSKVVANMRGNQVVNDNRTQLVIYAPQQRSESCFESITV